MNIWFPAVGFEGLYEVSKSGKIRTVRRFYYSGKPLRKMLLKAKELSFKTDKDGYYYVGMRKNKKRYFKRVSRIVCETFHPNPENKAFVNHKNGNKKDNSVKNLEWATPSENESHSYRVLGKKPILNQLGKVGKLNANSKPLYQFTINGELVKKWESMNLAIKAGFTKKSLRQVLNGEFSQHKGYKWSR